VDRGGEGRRRRRWCWWGEEEEEEEEEEEGRRRSGEGSLRERSMPILGEGGEGALMLLLQQVLVLLLLAPHVKRVDVVAIEEARIATEGKRREEG